MANEITIVTLLGNQGDPIEYTVAAATAIAKGELMELTDPKTCKKVSGAGVALAGIAVNAKTATDGITKMACLTNVVCTATISSGGTTVLGSYARSASTDNTITLATTLDHETGKGCFKSLETGGNSEVVECLFRL